MSFKVEGSELGVKNCDFIATGETPEDVVEQMVKHLRKEHDINLPDKDVILEGGEDWGTTEDDSGAAVIVKRLRKELELKGTSATDVSNAPGPAVSGRPSSG